jgi:selenobiotic family peptide radical SAM maturase
MDEDLLALKMTVEGISSKEVAAGANLSVSTVDAAIDNAIKRGILLSPASLLRRDPSIFSTAGSFDDSFCVTNSFTLQWHITQTCDLHCKHCYDRTDRSALDFEKALSILDDLHDFCRKKQVKGRVSFSGGNPLLYPNFIKLYRGASERGFVLSILGNPSPPIQLEQIVSIQQIDFFQVSLEGLQKHNDSIRGSGHFERTVKFLEVLKDLNVYSMVMLTLTQDNIDQILPLGEYLRGLADTFNFNRLSPVGEGAQLKLPDRKHYKTFLESYLKAAEENPVLGLKDNLINIINRQKGVKPFGGCTGFGCGAAFNFLALLADGEVHACRKFPSLIGNINESSLAEIYDSEQARLYRKGCDACNTCSIRPGCGSCLAMAYSHGLNIFKEKDPYCFFTNPE